MGHLTPTSSINPQLTKLLPKESLEKWNVTNCAECDALNNALNAGADIKNLEMHTLKLDAKQLLILIFQNAKTARLQKM